MNNLKYYEDSLAYDFSMFSSTERKTEKNYNNIIPIPDVQKKRARKMKRASQRVSGKVSAILVTVFIIALLGGNVFLRSQIAETEQKIAKVNHQIDLADSKLAGVTFEMNQKISYNNLESSAIALGMRKMDKTQIVYIRTNDKNKAVVSNGELSAENK